MLHGKGPQYWMTKKYERLRRNALEDRTRYTDSELTELEIDEFDGRGKTDVDTYTVKQDPFPVDASIRSKKNIDIRRAHPEIGGGSL